MLSIKIQTWTCYLVWCGVVWWGGVVTWCHHHYLLFVCHLNNTWRQFSADYYIILHTTKKTQRKKFLRWFTFYMRFSNIVNICLVHCVFSNWICEINVFIINLLYKDSDWITNTWTGVARNHLISSPLVLCPVNWEIIMKCLKTGPEHSYYTASVLQSAIINHLSPTGSQLAVIVQLDIGYNFWPNSPHFGIIYIRPR